MRPQNNNFQVFVLFLQLCSVFMWTISTPCPFMSSLLKTPLIHCYIKGFSGNQKNKTSLFSLCLRFQKLLFKILTFLLKDGGIGFWGTLWKRVKSFYLAARLDLKDHSSNPNHCDLPFWIWQNSDTEVQLLFFLLLCILFVISPFRATMLFKY